MQQKKHVLTTCSLAREEAKCLSHEKVMTSCSDTLTYFGEMLTFLGPFGVKVLDNLLYRANRLKCFQLMSIL